MFLKDKLPELSPPVIDEPWRKALRDAAEYIREHGWCQHALSRGRSVCVLGAIIEVTQVPYAAANRFRDYLGGGSAMRWNDDPNRTKDEVISALLQAAGKE